MGVADYYKRFIQGFSRIACLITPFKKREGSLNGHNGERKVFGAKETPYKCTNLENNRSE